ncbi:MAG: hypothetical protein PVSMB1_19400 [Gemmatimonadaceae bacterium]
MRVLALLVLVGGVAVAAPSKKEIITKVVKDSQIELKACWEEALAAEPKLTEVRTVVEFTIEQKFLTDATVVETSVTGSEKDKLESCVTRSMKTWAFPQLKHPVTVRYPFVFKR